MVREESTDRDAEYLGDLGKTPGTDPVRALFVFLHLLERDADLACEVALGHAREQPIRADGFAHLAVSRSWLPLLRAEASGFSDRICLFFHLDGVHDL